MTSALELATVEVRVDLGWRNVWVGEYEFRFKLEAVGNTECYHSHVVKYPIHNREVFPDGCIIYFQVRLPMLDWLDL